MHSILHTARAAAAGILLTALLLYPGTKPVGKVLPCALYYHGAGDSPRIALTFDDGPHPRYTPQILEILSEYRAPSTFFVIGKNAQDYPDLVRRISAEGHEIANHTYSHRRIKDLSDQEIREEMDHCEQILLEIVNLRPALFRPPEGSINDSARLSAKDHGYDVVLWSVDTRDWTGRPTEEIVQEVLSHVQNGSIILLHDSVFAHESHTAQALRQFLPVLREQGYEFVRVSDLLYVVS